MDSLKPRMVFEREMTRKGRAHYPVSTGPLRADRKRFLLKAARNGLYKEFMKFAHARYNSISRVGVPDTDATRMFSKASAAGIDFSVSAATVR